MVRKATRLPANTRSLEEVVLGRVVSGETNSAQQQQPQQVSAAAATATLSNAKRLASGARRAPSTQHTTCNTAASSANISSSARHNASMIASASPSASNASDVSARDDRFGTPASVECMTQIASEVAVLDKRVRSLASSSTGTSTNSTHATSHRHAFASANRSDASLPTYHQQEIDKYLQQSMDEIHALNKARRGNGTRTNNGTIDATASAHVTHAVRDIRSTVRRLDRVFYEVASGDKQRHIAATKIAMAARAYITRQRFAKCYRALGAWRTRKCAQLLLFVEQFAAREEFINHRIDAMHCDRSAVLLRNVLAELRDVVLLNLPLRMRRLDETTRRFQLKQRTLLQCVFTAWATIALGPRSRKRVIADARTRHLDARHRLDKLGRYDLVTTEMVHDEFLKENIRVVRSRHNRHVLRMYFRILVATELVPMQRARQLAEAHDRTKTLVRAWTVWLTLFRATQVDKALARVSDRRTLERFERMHNLRRIDAHYRRTHVRKHLLAWATFGQRIRRVRKLFEDTTRENLGRLVRKWHVRAQYQHALRAHSVEAWRAYCRRVFQTPFRCWYVHTVQKKRARVAQETICVAYARRQRRHVKYTFFRLWKHVALFGNVEQTHSQLHLLQSVEDQKRMCLGLEANARLYQDTIAALHASIAQLERKVEEKQLELSAVLDATQVTRFGLHTAEQNIARVQGMLEAVRHVHPGTVARIEKLYSDTPLLSQDLAAVVQRHVATRDALASQIDLDETELAVYHAAAGSGVSEDDRLLLHRVKWVLSRLDLQQLRNIDDATRATAPTPRDATHQLCALFEFVRDGDTTALAVDNSPLPGSRSQITAAAATAAAASTSSGRVDSGGAPAAAAATMSCRQLDLFARNETWHDFVKALTLQFVPARMRSVRERLVERAAAMDRDVAELKANPHIYNLYSSAAQVSGSSRSSNSSNARLLEQP